MLRTSVCKYTGTIPYYVFRPEGASLAERLERYVDYCVSVYAGIKYSCKLRTCVIDKYSVG
jgi:hypothetical protein